MQTNLISEKLKRLEIPGHVKIVNGHGQLTLIKITTPMSAAEIYSHGAHITHFQKNGEPPLLFLSEKSFFAPDKAIRGGVPICLPWFGSRENFTAHGFARLAEWELIATNVLPDGSVKIHFRLPQNVADKNNFAGQADFIVTVSEALTMELQVENNSAAPLEFEECLHTYFQAGEIDAVSVTGLKGKFFLDKVAGNSQKMENADAIRFESEVDRVYLDTPEMIEINDAKLGRKILVKKTGSNSTVVWNPWIAKSKAMADFGDEEFRRMVCVESGNVGKNKIVLAPGKISTLKVILSSQFAK